MKQLKTLILGARGIIGGAFTDQLRSKESSPSNQPLILTPTSKELDLRQREACIEYFKIHQPERVAFFAGLSGGVKENIENPLPLMLANAQMANNIAEAIQICNSTIEIIHTLPSCVYPSEALQPYLESSLFQGAPEKTSQYFSEAKLYSARLFEALEIQLRRNQRHIKVLHFIASNVYGKTKNESSEKSHVIPALLSRFLEAKNTQQSSIEVWGDGNQIRDFLHTEDLARAMILALEQSAESTYYNVSTGTPTSIMNLAMSIKHLTGFNGQVHFKQSTYAGASTKLLNSDKIRALGWKPLIDLNKGLQKTIRT